jgi:tetratricopeptide (TPR) repeat protein
LRLAEPDSIQAHASNPQSLFDHFWKLRTAGEVARALSFCDVILELVRPSDADSQVRHANARAIALRDLCDYRGAYRTHLTARPFLPSAARTYVGDHYHGLGVTLMRLGEHVRAYKCLESARGFHEGEADKLARTDITAAMLLVLMRKPREAHAILDGVAVEGLRPDVERVRAQAYEAEGDTANARRAIASALYMLADSENVAARDEARKVLERIEGGAQ